MNLERLYRVIIRPRLSEKNARVAEQGNQYVFEVLNNATKTEIKTAVELSFNVEVESVTTSLVRAKRKMFRGRMGTTKSWKKAFVRLKDGSEIDFMATEKQ